MSGKTEITVIAGSILSIFRKFVLAISLVCLGYVAAHADAPVGKRIFVMKSPEKKTVWIYEGGKKGDINEETDDINLPGLLSLDTKKRLCGRSKRTKDDLDQTEMYLSLNLMIEKLRKSEKPRQLTESESESLSEVPFCPPFTFELRIISKLLQGWDLKEEKQARN